ncbi:MULTISPECIES: colicin immunity domain-containing protein [Pseudomonas]|uniref:colicin immunity domain-containing protein n=1 Tax=Pseudomonas TaxID=286 RepID=UPI001EFFDA9C|nr:MULTISPECIES: colicin immunity domain-containing protein [Pseudomonas]MCG8293872.1 colicin immunity domain-containing protein [Pseudomonas entomophila]
MSYILLEFARSFVQGRLSAVVFSEAYMELWKIERDRDMLKLDQPLMDECLSSIFCAADMYGPEGTREEYELDDEMLRAEVDRLLKKLGID